MPNQVQEKQVCVINPIQLCTEGFDRIHLTSMNVIAEYKCPGFLQGYNSSTYSDALACPEVFRVLSPALNNVSANIPREIFVKTYWSEPLIVMGALQYERVLKNGFETG